MLKKKVLYFSCEEPASNIVYFLSKLNYELVHIQEDSIFYEQIVKPNVNLAVVDFCITKGNDLHEIIDFTKSAKGNEFPVVLLIEKTIETIMELTKKYPKINYFEKDDFQNNIHKYFDKVSESGDIIHKLGNNLFYSMEEHTLYDTENKTIKLNRQEILLLEFLLKSSSAYQSYEVLQHHLSSKSTECSLDTLRTVVKNLRRKTYPKLVKNLSGYGYKINIESPDNLEDINILICDDHKSNVEFLNLLLKKNFSNIKVFKALGGKEAIKTLKKENIHIVLLDIEMPEVNGWEVARYIKSSQGEKNIATIFITSVYVSDKFKQEGFELGAVDYITKPVDRNLLINRLRLYIKNFKQEKKIVKQIAYSREQDKKLLQKEVMLAQSNLLEKIAHHWRQPLSALSLNANLISLGLQKGMEKEKVINTAENIVSLTKNLSDLIEQFQTFFKPNSEKNRFNVKKVINSILLLMRYSFTQNNIKLSLDLQSLQINGYENEFKQVIISLLNNCIDIMASRNIEKRFIRIEAFKKGDGVVISVIDNGGGVDESIEDKIYEPYFTTKHEYSGTGLSLYLCKELVHRHLKGILENENLVYEFKNTHYSCAKFSLILKNGEQHGK